MRLPAGIFSKSQFNLSETEKLKQLNQDIGNVARRRINKDSGLFI